MQHTRGSALAISLVLLVNVLALVADVSVTATPATADADEQLAMFDERPVDTTLHAADGEVRAVAQVGDQVIMGGSFTKVGPAKPGAAGVVDLAASSFLGGFPDVQGIVHAAVPDGSNGWFIAGQFSTVGGQARQNLARITAAGTVGAWNPGADGPVFALEATPDGDLIAGGDFATVNGTPASRLARISAATGTVQWAAAVRGSTMASPAAVRSLLVEGTRVYAGGTFTKVGTTDRRRLAAFSVDTGTLDATFVSSPSSTVRALALNDNELWIAGDFTSVDSQPRLRLARVDPQTGQLLAAGFGFDQTVYAGTADYFVRSRMT